MLNESMCIAAAVVLARNIGIEIGRTRRNGDGITAVADTRV